MRLSTSPPSPPAPLVELAGVSLAYGSRTVLSGLDLRVDAGHITTLVGPNGAGKTSLARLVLGLAQPDAGTVRRLPGLVTGYMPQKVSVDDTLPLTARRFVGLAGSEPAAVDAALARVGAARLATQPVQRLSGGEFQRVLLARAIVRRPRLLVLDEPAQGVDVGGQDALYGLIGELRDETGCGVLMISHDLHLVMAESDRVVCINQHVCCSGTPEAVSAHPEFVALFGDGYGQQPAAHVALYTHHHDHEHELGGEVHVHGPDCRHDTRLQPPRRG
ncbi:MAG: zinc ABC transporter ATP-binding protein ZnuC [Gammaproteobacteria bacterium]